MIWCGYNDMIWYEYNEWCSVKIGDVGVASQLTPSHQETSSFEGTPLYAAPELFSKPPRAGFGSDLWSMGVVMYEVCCLEVPFDVRSSERMVASMHEKIEEINNRNALHGLSFSYLIKFLISLISYSYSNLLLHIFSTLRCYLLECSLQSNHGSSQSRQTASSLLIRPLLQRNLPQPSSVTWHYTSFSRWTSLRLHFTCFCLPFTRTSIWSTTAFQHSLNSLSHNLSLLCSPQTPLHHLYRW